MLTIQIQKAERLAAITQKVGFTLWQLQELEGATAVYFVLVAQARRGMGATEGNALIENAQSQTFGKTVSQLGRAGLLKPDIQQRFGNLLKERNWLVHNSRDSSRDAVHDDLVMRRLLVRLESMVEESSALLKELGALAETCARQHGVSEQEIAERTKRLLQAWQTSDAS
jgi:uncharacterized protein YutE (UPF0331/DUF86 family)